MDEGNLVPDSVVIGMVDDKLKSLGHAAGVIFDGFPRTVPQAAALDQLLIEKGTPISGMIALNVEEEELFKRIKERGKTSGRADDQDDDKVRNRIKVYNEETLPVANYYQDQGKFREINGIGQIEDIFTDICSEIDHLKQ